jgi:hypothetical protein
MILWMPRWFRQGGRLDNEQAAEEIANMTLAGVLAPVKPKAQIARVTPIRPAKRSAKKR